MNLELRRIDDQVTLAIGGPYRRAPPQTLTRTRAQPASQPLPDALPGGTHA